MAEKWGIDSVEDSLPISFIGTGANMNAAIDNGLARAAKLLGMSVNEVKNRCTITGSIDIGRAPGVITATLLVPKEILAKVGLLEYAIEQYGE